MKNNRQVSAWSVAAALAWCIAVPGFYYINNYAYYQEKIGVFGRFLFRVLN